MELDVVVPQKLKVRSVQVYAKVSDSCSYQLRDEAGKKVADRDDYVPSFFPGDDDGGSHYGDYLILDIELDTGLVLNWRKPDPKEVALAFKLVKEDDND